MRIKLAALAGLLLISAFTGCAEVAVRDGRFAGPEADLPISSLDLQRLIDQAKDGDVVEVPLGRYLLSKPLAIAGRKNLHIAFAPGTQVRLADSRDVRVYCMYGNVRGLVDRPMLEIVNSQDVLVAQLKAFQPGNFPHLREISGQAKLEIPSSKTCALFVRERQGAQVRK